MCKFAALSFLALWLSLTGATAPLFAAEEQAKGKLSLPGQACQTVPLEAWTDQEKWVWKQVCEGKIADFSTAKDYGGKLDPAKRNGWQENRVLRPAFFVTILLHEPFRSALPHYGVRIKGAWFIDPLDLSDASLAHPLSLRASRFDEIVALDRLHTPFFISLDGSTFAGKLNMNGLQATGGLFMREKARFAEVDLTGAKVGGYLVMIGSTFAKKLNMNGLQVGGGLFMNEKARFAEVDLTVAKVGGQLVMDGSTFAGKLNMNGLQVTGDLFMNEKARFAEVDLTGAKVGGQLGMDGPTFTGELKMESLQVTEHLFMRNAEIEKESTVRLIFAKIGGNLNISGSKIPSLDLTGTLIHGELRLGSEIHPSVRWWGGAKLTLRNTEVGALQDSEGEGAWPSDLELDGFTYGRLGGFAAGSTDMAARDISWFKKLLAKQKSYSPQPYEQLASVFLKSGYRHKAEDILYQSKERERIERAKGLSWWWLTALKLSIAYGHYTYMMIWVLIWVLIFTVIGVLVLRISHEGPRNGMPYGIFFSLDLLLPIVRLRERHYQIDLSGWARYYFYFHRAIGWVLASLLVAGLTGVMKK
jgi:hypothetical protein